MDARVAGRQMLRLESRPYTCQTICLFCLGKVDLLKGSPLVTRSRESDIL